MYRLTGEANRLTYRAEFHGFQDLAYPPPSRPNGKPYCSIAVQTMPFDYSRTKDPKYELDTFHHYTVCAYENMPCSQILTLVF